MMTLTRFDDDLWVDRLEIVAVRTYTDQMLQRRVELTLRNGTAFEVAVGTTPGSGTPMTEEERDEQLVRYLDRNLGDRLEDLKPPPTTEEIADLLGLPRKDPS